MQLQWLKVSPSLSKGIDIINQLEDGRFEQFVKRIALKLSSQQTEIFTGEEKQKLEKIFKLDDNNLTLVIKTVVYLLKRMLKYVFKPIYLKSSLNSVGLTSEKADHLVKVWSLETRTIFNELGVDGISNYNSELNISSKLNAELSSDYQKKVKIPKAYIILSKGSDEQELELNHPELYSMFLQLEAVQTELDSLM